MTVQGYRWFPDGLPDDLRALDDLDLLRALDRPTLIRVPGSGAMAPRVVATLLHGNEPTGYHAMMRILRRRRSYPFDLFVVVGNVRAALAGGPFRHRYLDGQVDFNRIWGGDHDGELGEAALGILAELETRGAEAAVDVHNNSGHNPFYAIVTRLHPVNLNLATLFTTTLLHWELRVHTFMEALDNRGCAAIAVECGLPGRPESLAFAVDGLRRFLGEPPIPTDRNVRDYDLLGRLRKVVVRPDLRFAFGGELGDGLDLVIAADADAVNFRRVPAGHVVARVRPGVADPVLAVDADGSDVTDSCFRVTDGRLVTTCTAIPVMMTRTVEAARKDCLFYLADPLP